MSVPAWLSAPFIEKALRRSENDDSICIVDCSIKPATNKGDNYTSDMHRVTVEYRHNQGAKAITEKISIIVKVAPTAEGIHKDLIAEAGLFGVEIKMMTTTLKEMQLILKDKKLSGRCLYTQEKDPPLLIIEDLAPLGFRMADRQAGLDLHHCILALRGLAKFHASSVAVYEKTPKYKETYVKGIFNTGNPPDMIRFFTSGMKSLAKAVKSWPELDDTYADKLDKLADTAYERASESRIPDETEFNVINHGDFWVNNMLFKYNDDGKVIDHIFVDFQLCVYGSPAVDLAYFFNTSPSEEVLSKHTDNLIEEYVKVLSETMKKIGCKRSPPSIADIKKSLAKRDVYGFVAACTILPIVLIDKSQAQNIEEIMGQDDGEFNNKSYENPIYKKTMLRRLPQWKVAGLLEA
ncbi:uncharacterized protein LOC123261583 [Cotesia glomerata]|uniref:CHK kinase-like domain-containing protein n=1 Tax=Cotesia glomerata TaxID=32391 RepID=A0AAV7IB35_COTGL|nr:uncharacterized protein LOC123261583 [Cotesia glomerata]XP_044579194.1 uncharacterized protein LOC123261583 [Cotesia glomerata]KAH0548878.1 hypothetical protein KQX54_003744 [Cotesia glomerata]